MKLKLGHRYLLKHQFPNENEFIELIIIDESKDTYKVQYQSGAYHWILKKTLGTKVIERDFGKTRFRK